MSELSVVIPTFGRPHELRRTLAALPRDVETIVVADAREQSPPAGALRAERPGASAARNVGWRAATTPIVLFLGDDVVAGPDLIPVHLAEHARRPQPTAAVLGHVEWARELRVTPFMRFLERGLQFDYGRLDPDDTGWWALYTANVSLKRELLERSGGFDEESFPFLYEDLELGYRLSKLGLELSYAAAARAEHRHSPTLAEYRERMRSVGAAERRLIAKHPELDPYFKPRFDAVLAAPAPLGLSGRLAGLLPRSAPLIGERIHASAEARWLRTLAIAFMEGWHQERG